MALIDWISKIEEKLIEKGLSLKSDKNTLLKNKQFFNKSLRDLMAENPNKRFHHIILSMKDHYDIEDICDILDDHNKSLLRMDYMEENNLIKSNTKLPSYVE